MREEGAPGLPADWLNGWLAALGVVVLVRTVRLSWTSDPTPIARFTSEDDDSIADQVAHALPDLEALETLAIARMHPGAADEMKRNVDLRTYRERARLSRANSQGPIGDFSLSLSVTDLVHDPKWKKDEENLPHSPFDPPAPRGVTLFERLRGCRVEIENEKGGVSAAVSRSLAGDGRRIASNGLGFDARRLVSGVQSRFEGKVFTDPVVELLCFYGLSLFPLRGNGRRERTRGWSAPSSRRGSFTWPTWSPELDAWGIDALLDRFHGEAHFAPLRRIGVTGAFQSVPYQRKGEMDQTRAYASEPLPWP